MLQVTFRWFFIGAALVAMVSQTNADVRRQRTVRRPYIVEIGEPYRISEATIKAESLKINDMRAYLNTYGYPDYAEIQEIQPDWPWDSYEVRLFYLRRNIEVDFGHVLSIEAASAELGLLKFKGGIPASKRLQIEALLAPPEEEAAPEVAVAPPKSEVLSPRESLEAAVARVEMAAERASLAADRAVERSAAAEAAANRTSAVVEKVLSESSRR